jgi:hypothetical protein
MGALCIPNVSIPGNKLKSDRIKELLDEEECENITILFSCKTAL